MNIDELRSNIDRIDSEIAELFQQRMEITALIADYKAENSLPVFDGERENAVTDKVASMVDEEFVPYVKKLYRTIFEQSRSYQEKRMNKDE